MKHLIKHPSAEEMSQMTDLELWDYGQDVKHQYLLQTTKNRPAGRLIHELLERMR